MFKIWRKTMRLTTLMMIILFLGIFFIFQVLWALLSGQKRSLGDIIGTYGRETLSTISSFFFNRQ
ncbi:MAG: hypothetical protein KAR24_00565 [Candidatus Pacebacteria bacterium]|nr:hypothetical protein [Candidatus Paceibacterota bacterium]